MEIFIRHAAHTNYLPNKTLTKAYDARFLYITEGSGRIFFQDYMKLFAANTLIYYPAGTAYLPVADDSNKIKFVTLNFDFHRQKTEKTIAMPPVPIEVFDESKAIMSHMHLALEIFEKPFVIHELSAYRTLFLEIVEEHGKMTERSNETAAALLQYICCKLAEYGMEQEENVCVNVMHYIFENYKNIKTNNEIAAHFNYHPFYLSTLFKQETGSSLHKYIMNFKLTKGAELLLDSRKSITEIAASVGFCNADHFSKCFFRKFGCTPTAYRKSGFLV